MYTKEAVAELIKQLDKQQTTPLLDDDLRQMALRLKEAIQTKLFTKDQRAAFCLIAGLWPLEGIEITSEDLEAQYCAAPVTEGSSEACILDLGHDGKHQPYQSEKTESPAPIPIKPASFQQLLDKIKDWPEDERQIVLGNLQASIDTHTTTLDKIARHNKEAEEILQLSQDLLDLSSDAIEVSKQKELDIIDAIHAINAGANSLNQYAKDRRIKQTELYDTLKSVESVLQDAIDNRGLSSTPTPKPS